MRKYDSRNKINIGIIVGICLVAAIIFSYFLIKEINLSKIKYELEPKTLVFDIDKNIILLKDYGFVKKKWNNKYYLMYDKEQYQIGNNVIAYNSSENSLLLYGKFYQVNSNSKVDITDEETKLNNLAITRFYKISDRKYLLVDSLIKSEDKSLNTKNYLVVELDKQGNAILYNNSINLKTFSETKLVTSLYTFDIANELLIFENKTVDLKKILGTTNEYNKLDKNDKDKESSDTDDKDNDNKPNPDKPTPEVKPEPNPVPKPDNNDIITDEEGEGVGGDEIVNKTVKTSIIKITPSIDNISVDYVIYDNIGKYLSTFVEVKSNYGNNIVHLQKNTTTISLMNLKPCTEYTLTFKYTYMDSDKLKEDVVGTYKVSTLTPNINLNINKVTNKYIEYTINKDKYNIDSAKLYLYVDGVRNNNYITINNNNLVGKYNIKDIEIDNNKLVELSLEDIYINSVKIDKVVKASYFKEAADNSNEGDKNE